MVSLKSVQKRFEVPLTIIEGGSGIVRGVIAEAEQNSLPAYNFAKPRRVFRVQPDSIVRPGMVLLSPAGERLLVGDNGPSESWRGVLFRSYRLFAVSKQVKWERRAFAVDPITQLERDLGLVLLGRPWVVTETTDRELSDPKLKRSFEQMRFVSGAAIQTDDILDGRTVSKSDTQLGITVGLLV